MNVFPRLCLVLLAARCAGAELPPLDLGGVRETHVMIPMRDGTRLSAYVYSPSGDGRWPVIFEQRYAPVTGTASRRELAALAAHGYVAARVNFRGSQESEGEWRGYRALGWGGQQDGYDLVEWFARQPWSNGRIGTFGGSQGGFAQNFLAVTQPPHLVCQYMTDTGLSLFHEGYRLGGAAKPERFKKMDAVARDPADNRALLAEWFRHPHYDDYWRAEDCTLHFPRMDVPCFTIGSWYDFMSVGSIESFIGRQHRGGANSRGRQQLVLGPWLHGGIPKSNVIGEMKYPENARFDTAAHQLRWFDHFLKGVDNGVEREPAVRYYVMGAVGEPGAPGNVWRTAPDWPVAAQPTPYFLHAGGRLDRRAPDAETSTTAYRSDPRRPMELPFAAFPGARDARAFEAQAEVRTFTTEPLVEPVEWTGRVRAELYVASTARDTDFIVRVSDVYPDGRSILIMDYVRRARYRDSWEQETLLEPGRVYRVGFDVGSLSQIFNRGHRIRITVASTGAPFYEPNPQTGEPIAPDLPANAVAATNTIHHERARASHVIAPVVR
ncbi:CocE/NonD family hydrolase [Horticoccus sp. 23ND18S-11]|uniref:CocE/NonD family hydrolase n=1 Tax=Horticoccus sp. 23ND18S-11 TaxID=3391832 RepID=UPI0039C8D7CC